MEYNPSALATPSCSPLKPRRVSGEQISQNCDLQILQLEEVEEDCLERFPVLHARAWIIHLDRPAQLLGYGCHRP